MIEAKALIDKMGKKAFVEFASKSQYRGERMIDAERRRARGRGKILSLTCQHGVSLIENFERTKNACEAGCGQTKASRGFTPRDVDYVGYNAGLGCFTEGYSDFKKACKKKGVVPIGTDRI